MVAKNANFQERRGFSFWEGLKKDYTLEEIKDIINRGSVKQKRDLSRKVFNESSFYRQFIMYYSSLLKNVGMLIPNPSPKVSLQDNAILRKYNGALNTIEQMKLKKLLSKISFNVLIDGVYYGIIHTMNKENFILMDLPYDYCRSRFQDEEGRDIIEFNVAFFSQIADKGQRESALKTYPKIISSYYRAWERNREKSSWMLIPTNLGVSFNLFGSNPLFLSTIIATMQYDEMVNDEILKGKSEIEKILVQEMPHLTDGTLPFEPEEVEVMHNGTVEMLAQSNPNVSVLTSYGKVHIEQSKTTDSVTHTMMKQGMEHVYDSSGISSHVFSSKNSPSVKTSIQYDISIMMVLGNQYEDFITQVINDLYGNRQINFKYTLLPVSHYNEEDFADKTLKLAQYGYSLLLPAIANGFSQRDLLNIKTLENELLNLTDILIPPQSSHTQGEGEQIGRPPEEDDKKSEKTEENEESKK